MVKAYTYTLNPHNRGHQHSTCQRCGDPLQMGQQITAHKNSRSPTKQYHKECYEAMFI